MTFNDFIFCDLNLTNKKGYPVESWIALYKIQILCKICAVALDFNGAYLLMQTYNPSTTYASFPLKISQQFFTNKNG